MSSSTPEIDRSPVAQLPAAATLAPKINESLLTNAFDDCLKLVEKSVNNNSNKGSTNKTRTKDTPKFVKKEPDMHHKHELTHKSRKFRYSDETKGAGGAPIVMPPPPFDPESLPMMSENEDEARASMLMSWYMAGYHTGYFEAMKKFKN